MPAANWLHLSKVEFATTDHEPRRRTSLDKRYYGFEGYARGLSACPLVLRIGLTEQLCRNLIEFVTVAAKPSHQFAGLLS